MSSRIKFHALIKLLSKHGLECAKLTKTTTHCVQNTHDLFHGNHLKNYSCIDAGPFISFLFIDELDVREDIFDQLPKYETYYGLKENTFQDMTMTWFHIDNALGAHECNLIFISSDEIYFIDYYMETNRDQLFRVIKFDNEHQARSLIKNALYDKNEEAFDILFDFQESSDSNRYKVKTDCHIFNITKLPTLNNLMKLWILSEPILDKDFLETIENAKIMTFNLNYWHKFLKESDYEFKDKYRKYMIDLNKIYEQYVVQLEKLNLYYTVL